MNKLKPYYAYVGVPIGLLVLGTIVFFDAIMGTVRGNPHPEINYIIFVLMIAGAAMMMAHVFRINREGRLVHAFFDALKKKALPENLQRILSSAREDVLPVLSMLQGLMGKPITAVQHDALEHELTRFEAKQARRLLMAQFMGGLMVGMGLLGTFIGLLGALSEIGKLIGAFGGAVSNTDPVSMIQELVTRLTAPMQAMGVAFSASLFGVLGSLVMGVLLVSVKGCASELNTMVRSKASLATDFTSHGEQGLSFDLDPLQEALNDLAEQSPAFKLMSVALDQSERRVRDLINTMVQISSRLEINQAGNAALVDALQSRLEIEDATLQSMQAQQASLAQIATRWGNASQIETQIASLAQEQIQLNERFMVQLEQSTEQHQVLAERLIAAVSEGQTQQAASASNIATLNKTMAHFSDSTVATLRDVVGVQRRHSDQMTEILQTGFKDMVGAQRRSFEEFTEVTKTSLSDIAGAQRRSADESNKELANHLSRVSEVISNGQTEQAELTQQIGRITDALANLGANNQAGIQRLMDQYQRNFENSVRDQADANIKLANILQASQHPQMAANKGLDKTLGELSEAFRRDAEVRITIANRLELNLQDYSARQEQFAQSVAQSITMLTDRASLQPTQA